MKDMTYGVLPSREDFDEAFAREVHGDTYHIRLGYSDSRACDGFQLGDGDWTSDELYPALVEIVEAWNSEGVSDNSMDAVASILFSLGFEWI